MRISGLVFLFIGLLALSQGSWARSSRPQSSTAAAAPSDSPADDPAFAGFQPVTKGIKPPKATSAPDPKFPDLPEGSEQQGTVVLLIGVNVKGHVAAVRVLRSDEPAFETTAVETVKKWKFKPAEKDGHAIPVQVTVEMKFQR